MQTFSSLYVGKYFLFLLSAKDTCPLKVQFKDGDLVSDKRIPSPRGPSSSKSAGVRSTLTKAYPRRNRAQEYTLERIPLWKEKIYLYPAILSRKWTEYRYQDRFIPAAKYDNVLPIHVAGNFANPVNQEAVITLSSPDMSYRNLEFLLLDHEGNPAFRRMLPRLFRGNPQQVLYSVSTPGVYRMALKNGEDIFFKSEILFYRKLLQPTTKGERGSVYRWDTPDLFCSRCRTGVRATVPRLFPEYVHKNYIPIKDFMDLRCLRYDFIVDFITGMDHPPHFRSGLVHLLNMIRLATLSDETTIMTNLFRDDPSFAHYVTDRLFLFKMIPVMEDRELQRILNTIDDTTISTALKNETPQLVNKVLHNVSRRRAQFIRGEMGQEIGRKAASSRSERAKWEMHRRIKFHFEHRFGRELKIPTREYPVYLHPSPDQPGESAAAVCRHTGEFLRFDGTDARLLSEHEISNRQVHTQQNCLAYDRDILGSRVFVPTGMTESTLFLTCTLGIRYALIHSYDWNSSVEDFETLENLPRHCTVALRRMSSSVVLTIGVIDGKGAPHEQVIRLSTGIR